MDGPGEISAYRGLLFLGAIRKNKLVSREESAFYAPSIQQRIVPHLNAYAAGIAAALQLGPQGTTREALLDLRSDLYQEWARSISRICIGLRRAGTGGAFLITPSPILEQLELHHELPYRRVAESMILGALERQHYAALSDRLRGTDASEILNIMEGRDRAEADMKDRASEMRGASQMVASLAAADGLVLLSPTLEVQSFGTKIRSSRAPRHSILVLSLSGWGRMAQAWTSRTLGRGTPRCCGTAAETQTQLA